MSTPDKLNNHKLERLIASIQQKYATGKLSLIQGDSSWFLYFFRGSLAYAIDPVHRVRRLLRVLKQQNSKFALDNYDLNSIAIWEYQILVLGVQKSNFTVAQARSMIASVALEVLFVATNNSSFNYSWESGVFLPQDATGGLTLSVMSTEQLIRGVQKLQSVWQSLNLDSNLVYFAPVLEVNDDDLTSSTLVNLSSILKGKYNFWDLAMRMKRPPDFITRVLHHFIQQNRIKFVELPDLELPVSVNISHQIWSNAESLPTTNPPLITCIDDSPTVCRMIEHYVKKNGYRFLGISQSIEAIALLIKYQPDFIFLDLMMPVVNGYEICTQLRRIDAFKSTPVVILTGNDGLIDRMRAKMVGATEFVAKPVTPIKIISTIQKYLKKPDN